MRIAPIAATIVVVALVGCDPDEPAPRLLEPTPTSSDIAKKDGKKLRPGDECPEAVEGKGLRVVESYPPRPYFEAFNLWRTTTRTGRTGCLIVVAGRQIRHESEGENDPVVYEPNGWLFIFGDYRHQRDGILPVEVPLPRPVRVVQGWGHGYRSKVALQSLTSCQTVTYRVGSKTFDRRPLAKYARCPDRAQNRPAAQGSPTPVIADCVHPKVRPSRMVLACADLGFFARRLVWTTWNRFAARGHGVFVTKWPPRQVRRGMIELTQRSWCLNIESHVLWIGKVTFAKPLHGQESQTIYPSCGISDP